MCEEDDGGVETTPGYCGCWRTHKAAEARKQPFKGSNLRTDPWTNTLLADTIHIHHATVFINFLKMSKFVHFMSIFGIRVEMDQNKYKQAYVWSSGSWDNLWYFQFLQKKTLSLPLRPVG